VTALRIPMWCLAVLVSGRWEAAVAAEIAGGVTPSLSAAAAVTTSIADLPTHLDLHVGDSQLLQAPIERVAVGNGRVLSVAGTRPDEVLLLGEAPGTTTLRLWLRGGRVHRVTVDVHEVDLPQQLDQVRRLLEGTQRIVARIAGDRIVLEGTQVSDEDRRRAKEIAAAYPKLVLDFIERVGWDRMIEMDVRIVEIRRDQVAQLGLRWDDAVEGPSGRVDLRSDGTRSASLGLASAIGSRVDLLQQKGLAETVARPTLSCRSGGVARFVAGGEIPLPVTDGFGALNVSYKEYGVILEIRPQADSTGVVQAEVEVELSQVDPSVRVQNFPGFVKRRSVSAVNLHAGETVAIAGLVAREQGRERQAVPGLGRLPVAGVLFSSRRQQQRQTELLVLITPRLITQAVAGTADASAEQQRRVEAGLREDPSSGGVAP
jgi:pilus assembly protein CpaC